jgi:hypothetical protein
MKRVNIAVSEETHRKAKVIAVLKGTTLNEYFASAIEQTLRKEAGVLKTKGKVDNACSDSRVSVIHAASDFGS